MRGKRDWCAEGALRSTAAGKGVQKEETKERGTALEKIMFTSESGEAVAFYVLEQTRIGGKNYILVTDCEDGDGEALILRDLSEDGEAESIYDIVTDEKELEAVAGIFSDMMDDVELV